MPGTLATLLAVLPPLADAGLEFLA